MFRNRSQQITDNDSACSIIFLSLKKKQEQRADIEAEKMKIEWGSQIRNYATYKLVKDVRTGRN
jgi:protein subunit release factor B